MEPGADVIAVGDSASSAGSLQQYDASAGSRRCIAAGFSGQVPMQAAEDRITATQREVSELRGVLHRLVAKVDAERQARLEAHAEVMAELARPAHHESLLAQALAVVQREHSAQEADLRRFVEESQRSLKSAIDVHVVELHHQTQRNCAQNAVISELESAEDCLCSSSLRAEDERGDCSKLGSQTSQVALDVVSCSASASTVSESPCCKQSPVESVGAVQKADFASVALLPTGDVSPGSSSSPTAHVVTCADAHEQRTSSPAMAEHDSRDVGLIGDASCPLAANASCDSLLTPPPPNMHADMPVAAEVSPATTLVVRLSSAPAFGGSEQFHPQTRGHPGPQLQMLATFGSPPANAARRRPEHRVSPLLASSGSQGQPNSGGLDGPGASPCKSRLDQGGAFTLATHSHFAANPCAQMRAQLATTPGARVGLPGTQSMLQPSTQAGMQMGMASPVLLGRQGMQRARSTPRLGCGCAPGAGDPIVILRPGVATDPRWKAGIVANTSHGLSHLNGLAAMPGSAVSKELRPHQRPLSVPVQERRRSDPRAQKPPAL